MEQTETICNETEIKVQHIRFTVKRGYNPPLLWFEKFMPKAERYVVKIQANVNQDLVDAVEALKVALSKSLELKPK